MKDRNPLMRRYYIDSDEDGHWYIIPSDKRDEWRSFLHVTYELYEDIPLPEGVVKIGGSPSQVTFEAPVFV